VEMLQEKITSELCLCARGLARVMETGSFCSSYSPRPFLPLLHFVKSEKDACRLPRCFAVLHALIFAGFRTGCLQTSFFGFVFVATSCFLLCFNFLFFAHVLPVLFLFSSFVLSFEIMCCVTLVYVRMCVCASTWKPQRHSEPLRSKSASTRQRNTVEGVC